MLKCDEWNRYFSCINVSSCGLFLILIFLKQGKTSRRNIQNIQFLVKRKLHKHAAECVGSERLLLRIVYVFLVHRQWQMDSITSWHLITEHCVGFRFSFSTLSNASFSIADIISISISMYIVHWFTRTVNSLCLKWNDMTLNDMLFHLCRTKERLPLCSVSVIWLNYLVQNFRDYSKLLSNITFAPVEHWNRFNSLGQNDATQYTWLAVAIFNSCLHCCCSPLIALHFNGISTHRKFSS